MVRKGIPHKHVDLSLLVSIKRSSEILLADVYKPPGRAWSEADVITLLNVSSKPLLGGDLNVNHSIWSSQVSNPSG